MICFKYLIYKKQKQHITFNFFLHQKNCINMAIKKLSVFIYRYIQKHSHSKILNQSVCKSVFKRYKILENQQLSASVGEF